MRSSTNCSKNHKERESAFEMRYGRYTIFNYCTRWELFLIVLTAYSETLYQLKQEKIFFDSSAFQVLSITMNMMADNCHWLMLVELVLDVV